MDQGGHGREGLEGGSKGARVAPGNLFSRAATYTPAGSCLTMDHPITLRMQQIINSPQGRHAAMSATSAGLPAMAGVDPLLSTALGADYGKHNFATSTAGDHRPAHAVDGLHGCGEQESSDPLRL